MKEYKCLRCTHKWFPRSNKKPKLCPSCKSKYWDEVRDERLTGKYKRKI